MKERFIKDRDRRVFCEYDNCLLELGSKLENSIKLAKFPSPKFISSFKSIFSFQVILTLLTNDGNVHVDLNLRKKIIKCYIWSMALYGAETWTLWAVDQKYLESFEIWCWRRMEKISWTDHVRNEEVLLRINEKRNILHEIRKRKANWIGHILRRNCLLKQVIEGKIKRELEVARRRG